MRFDKIISGNLDQESSFFDDPVPTESGAELWINMENVTLINSTGIRRWMKWTQNLPASLKVFLINCPMNFVVQSSLIEGFLPSNCHVQSLRSYFFCDRDSEELPVTLNRGKDYFYAEDTADKKSEIRLPRIPCPKCSQTMEPDFLESRAFAFLKT